MLSSLLVTGLIFVPLVQRSAGEVPDPVRIGGHECTVLNAEASSVAVIFHGYLNYASDYYALGRRIAEMGYTVVIPLDCNGVDSLARAAGWGKSVSADVQQWAGGRRVAIIGHSMGGAAAMAAAKFTPGLSAYIAMHPAPILSGLTLDKVSGPILFTTGTNDGGTFAGTTSPDQARSSYQAAAEPKALVNVKGDVHWSSLAAKGMEWGAVVAWLGCFVKSEPKDCAWLQHEMCKDSRLEWCSHEGLRVALANNVVSSVAASAPAPTPAPLPEPPVVAHPKVLAPTPAPPQAIVLGAQMMTPTSPAPIGVPLPQAPMPGLAPGTSTTAAPTSMAETSKKFVILRALVVGAVVVGLLGIGMCLSYMCIGSAKTRSVEAEGEDQVWYDYVSEGEEEEGSSEALAPGKYREGPDQAPLSIIVEEGQQMEEETEEGEGSAHTVSAHSQRALAVDAREDAPKGNPRTGDNSGDSTGEQSEGIYPVGQAVEYNSARYGRWVPAVVVGHGDGYYDLDCRKKVEPAKIRLPRQEEDEEESDYEAAA